MDKKPLPKKLAMLAAGLLLLTAGCSGAGSTGTGSGGSDDNTITALMVGNPQMEDIQKLTADNFTKQTGITVKFTILPENELRDKVTQDVANQGGQYDVATVGAYEVPIWAKNGWLQELSTRAGADAGYDTGDLLKPMVAALTGADGKMYGAPFYGESSFLMYNKDLFAAKGLTMPEHPTWDQVASYAAKLNDKSKGVAGICLRGLPGWGELFAPLTTVVSGAKSSPQPGRPRRQIPATPLPLSFSLAAKSATCAQVGCSGMVRPLAAKRSLLYMRKDDSP